MDLNVGNNGNRLIEVLHFEGLLKDGMSAEQIEVIGKPYMINPKNMEHDDFWEDVFCRAGELGYKLFY